MTTLFAFVLAQGVGDLNVWAMLATAVGSGGLVKALEMWNSRASRREQRENAEIDRLWKQINTLQEELGELKNEVKQLRTEKHDAQNKLQAALGHRDAARAEAEKWKKAAHYWYGAAQRAANEVGPDKARELGLVRK